MLLLWPVYQSVDNSTIHKNKTCVHQILYMHIVAGTGCVPDITVFSGE